MNVRNAAEMLIMNVNEKETMVSNGFMTDKKEKQDGRKKGWNEKGESRLRL
jgi:hypothetical protein